MREQESVPTHEELVMANHMSAAELLAVNCGNVSFKGRI